MAPDDSDRRDSTDRTRPESDEARRRAREARHAARDAFREEWHNQRRAHRKRKERVLHTRISEDLSEEIRRLADDMRLPVSNLVRNVLEEAFSVVENVSDNVGDLFEDVLGEAEEARERILRQMDNAEQRRSRRGRNRSGRQSRSRSRGPDIEDEFRADEAAETAAKPQPETQAKARTPKEFPDVLGWQPLVLNRQQACADCGLELQKGDRAFLGVKTGGLTDLALCAECVRN